MKINPPERRYSFRTKKRRAWRYKKIRLVCHKPRCSANFYAFVILRDGKVTICEELYLHPKFIIGDLKKQSIMEVRQHPSEFFENSSGLSTESLIKSFMCCMPPKFNFSIEHSFFDTSSTKFDYTSDLYNIR